MSVFVVDASVAVKWLLPEEHFESARQLLDPGHRLHAPDFLLLETDNAFSKHVRRGGMARADAEEGRRTLRTFPIEYHGLETLLDRAYEIAVETRTSVYDCLYAALAEALGARMVTADRRFFERISATPFAGLVMWVEDIGRPEAPAKRRDAKGRRRKRR
jgi:predicted nucleic acid-binding protein